MVSNSSANHNSRRWEEVNGLSQANGAKVSRAAFFQSSPVRGVKIMWVATVVQSLSAIRLHWA